MPAPRHYVFKVLLLTTFTLLGTRPASAQVQPATTTAPVSLTIDEALQIALINNYAIQRARLDVDDARSQIRAGWGELMPQVDVTSSYTRNVRSANPFSGSAAGNIFSSFGFLDWLAFNEEARTDDNADTNPIPAAEFFTRQQEGREAAGVVLDNSSNPFSVPNQYRSGVSLTQKLFDGRAIWGASGASRYLKPFNEYGLQRQEQLLIDQVRQAFYSALLSSERARVVEMSVARTAASLEEVSRQVAQGVAPKFQRLSAEVELANQETDLVQTRNQAFQAADDLKLLLGMPVDRPLQLRGSLEAAPLNDYLSISLEGAAELADSRRPDLEQARLNISLEEIQNKVARAEFMPTLDASANLNYTGNVPSNRLNVIADPNDPFAFTTQENGYFSSSYWDWDFNVGLTLRWNLFNGFRSKEQLQQRKIATSKARLQYDELVQAVRLDVERSLRNLEAARERIESQRRNVERAELNYTYADARLREGVANPLEVRDASEQLDQSRLNYLQAVHDLLVARSAFETAVGMPIDTGTDVTLTSK